jgi:AAA domain, putative AbiEii toxin, Type IV TA system
VPIKDPFCGHAQCTFEHAGVSAKLKRVIEIISLHMTYYPGQEINQQGVILPTVSTFTGIVFKSGTTAGSQQPEIDLTPVTVFVGPNNAGKSLALTEMWTLYQTGDFNSSKIYARFINTESQQEEGVAPSVSRQVLLTLDGRSRLNIPIQQEMGDLQEATAPNPLAHLFRDNELRRKVRDLVFDAFGKYFIIDPTKGGQLRIRLSNRPPVNEDEERGLSTASIAFHAAAKSLDETSDGVRAFIGIITTLISEAPKIVMLDEPEAFLHPALATKLGKEISRLLAGSTKRLFAATHSAAFLMGCIQSGSPINIVRLTHNDGVGTTRILERSKLLHLMRNPLLRSTRVLEGLFYEAVVVAEGDSDRAFYQEVNERLLGSGDARGIPNCLFINAQGKDTIWDIVKPLRELGIPAVGIVDLDVVKVSCTKLLDGANVPAMEHRSMGIRNGDINRAIETANPGWTQPGGVNVLNDSDKQAANNFFDNLENYGVFVVRSGAVETWLPGLIPQTRKGYWLRTMFERMGEDPTLAGYVSPQAGDVWDFLGRIRLWVNNPSRQGIPA